MPQKKPSTNPAKLPGGRRFCYFVYGELITHPHFAFALRYQEALKLARGEDDHYKLNWEDSQPPDDKAPFITLHKQLQALALDEGQNVIIEMGSLMSKIDECKKSPHSKIGVDIWLAHLEFCRQFHRPPALEELRKSLWKSHAVPAANKNLGSSGQVKVDELLKKVWKSQSNELGPFIDRTTFTRSVEEMGLDVFPGTLLRQGTRCFDKLKVKLKRKPTEDEYLAEFKKNNSKTRKPFNAAAFHEFISLLAWPKKYHPLIKWKDLIALRTVLDNELKVTAASAKAASDALVVFDGITQLGWAMGFLEIGPLEGQLAPNPMLTTLEEEYNRLADELNRLPWLEDVLIGCDSAKLSVIARELKLPTDSEGALTRLKTVLCKQQSQGAVPLRWLAKEMPEIDLLTRTLDSEWFYRWPSLLWAEFDKN